MLVTPNKQFFYIKFLGGIISNYLNHRRCLHLQSWLHNCFVLITKRVLLNCIPILYPKHFMLSKKAYVMAEV